MGGLLLINFPAAAFFTLSAIDVLTRYTVIVLNESGSPIDSFVVTGPGVRVELGPVRAGKRAQRHVRSQGDGKLDFTAEQEKSTFSAQLEGYVTGSLGGSKTVRVKPGRAYEIE